MGLCEWLNVSCIWFSIWFLASPHQNSFLVNCTDFLKIKSVINNVTSDFTNLPAFAEVANSIRRCQSEVLTGGTSSVGIKTKCK